jgi:ribosomal protein S27AE
MWKLKACPRCGGDVFIDIGLDTWFEQCLLCGYQRELGNIHVFEAKSELQKEPVPVRRGRPLNKEARKIEAFD